MHILVVGSEGYVGSVLVEQLKEKAIKFSCLDPVWFKYQDILREDLLIKDVRDLKINKDLFNDVDVVIYLAAVSNDPMGKEFALATNEINCKQAIRVADESKKHGVKKFIYASSCSLYGGAGSSIKSEIDSLDPLTDYAKSKAQGEISLSKISSRDFSIICMRFATAAGPSPNLRLDLVVNDFVYEAIKAGSITLLSDGLSFRPIIDVRDMAESLIWASTADFQEYYLALNIGFNAQNFKILDLAELVSKNCDHVRIKTPDFSSPDMRSYQVDFSKYESLRGFSQPTYNIESTISGLKEQIAKIDDFKGFSIEKEKYQRLKQLTAMIDKGIMSKDLYFKVGS